MTCGNTTKKLIEDYYKDNKFVWIVVEWVICQDWFTLKKNH